MYNFEINSLSAASFALIFSHSEGCLFNLLIWVLMLIENKVPGDGLSETES